MFEYYQLVVCIYIYIYIYIYIVYKCTSLMCFVNEILNQSYQYYYNHNIIHLIISLHYLSLSFFFPGYTKISQTANAVVRHYLNYFKLQKIQIILLLVLLNKIKTLMMICIVWKYIANLLGEEKIVYTNE